MSSSDWVALGSLLVSGLAFAVSYVAYRLQAKTARSDDEKELADQIAAIQSSLAEMLPPASDGAVPQSPSMQTFAKNSNVNAALQTLLLRIGTLIQFADLKPDWYQNLVLATAAVHIGDPVTAGPYAEKAVELASRPGAHGWNPQTAAIARMLSLRMRASYYFNRGKPDDIDNARNDFRQARELIRNCADAQGPFVTAAQLAELYVRQTDFELDLGHNDHAAALMAKACRQWHETHAPAVRQAVGGLIYGYAHTQRMVPAGTLLTSEFVTGWEEFMRGLGSAAVGPQPPAAQPAAGLSDLHPIRVSPPDGG